MTQVTNTPYEALEVGQTASYSKTVEERDIQLFAAMSGDHNPVHLDAEFAKGDHVQGANRPRHVQRRPDQRGGCL